MQEPAGTSVSLHGTRAFYRKGCRCSSCRQANADYVRQTRKIGSPARKCATDSVDATRARDYLNYLSEIGIGRKTVNRVCGVGERIIRGIASGGIKRIARASETKILAIKPQEVLPRGSYVDNEITLQQIGDLVREGFSKNDIADRLYPLTGRLRVGEAGGRVRVATAKKVNKLYQALMAEHDERNNEYIDAA